MVSMYQDGQHTGSFENYMTDFTDVGVNDDKIYIGTTGDTTTFYDGILDDVRVYKSALTTEDIGELYAIYDQTVINYIDKASVSTEFMYLDGVPDVDMGSVTIGDGVGTDPIQYYAFSMDSNRMSGKQDMQFFIDQIDTIPTTFYKTNNHRHRFHHMEYRHFDQGDIVRLGDGGGCFPEVVCVCVCARPEHRDIRH